MTDAGSTARPLGGIHKYQGCTGAPTDHIAATTAGYVGVLEDALQELRAAQGCYQQQCQPPLVVILEEIWEDRAERALLSEMHEMKH